MARKAHVFRIFQTDDNGNVVDPDVWLDVLRIDNFYASEPRGDQDGNAGQVRQYAFRWGDDTISSWHMPPRQIHKLTVTQPNGAGGGAADPNAASVAMSLIERTDLNFRGAGSSALKGTSSTVTWVFVNEPDDVQKTGRKVTPLRITNNDLNNAITMPVPNAGDSQPPTAQGHGIQWTDYVQALQAGTVDDSQYVDVEVTDRFRIRFPPPYYQGHMITYVLQQRQVGNGPLGVEDIFQPPPRGAQGAPYRTDPIQTIVNVSWGGLAVEFFDGAS